MKRFAPFILLVLFAGGLAAIVNFVYRHSPEEMLVGAMSGFADSEAFAADIRIETLVSSDAIGLDLGDDIPEIRIPVAFEGRSWFRLPDDGVFGAKADLALAGGGEEPAEGALTIEWVALGDGMSYVFTDNFPESPAGAPDLSRLNGQWMSFTGADLSRLMGGDITVKGPEEEAEEGVTGSEERPDAPSPGILRRMLAGGELFAVSKQMVSGKVRGRSARHYLLGYDPDAMADFIGALQAAHEGRELTQSERDGISGMLGDFLIHAEVWIDKDTMELLKFGVDLRPLAGSTSAPWSITIEPVSFGDEVEIQAPAEHVPLLEMLLNSLIPASA